MGEVGQGGRRSKTRDRADLEPAGPSPFGGAEWLSSEPQPPQPGTGALECKLCLKSLSHLEKGPHTPTLRHWLRAAWDINLKHLPLCRQSSPSSGRAGPPRAPREQAAHGKQDRSWAVLRNGERKSNGAGTGSIEPNCVHASAQVLPLRPRANY